MCAIALLAVAATAAVAGAATSAYGAYQQGRAARAAADYEASMQEQTAAMTEQRVAGANFMGGVQADQIRTDSGKLLGEGRANMAAGNVDLSSGTAKFWELDVAKGTATDVGMTKYNAAQEAIGLRTDAWNSRTSAQLARFSGRNAQRAGNIAAAGQLSSVIVQMKLTID